MLPSMTSTQFSPQLALQQMLGGASTASLIYVAAELGLADILTDGPLSVSELASRTSCHAGALERILRGLTIIGVLSASDNGEHYALTELGGALRSDIPNSVRPAARLMGNPIVLQAWGGLLHTARTGETAFEHAVGSDFLTYFLANQDFARTFNAFMGRITADVTPAVVSAYDFTDTRTLVDVGGGNGTLLRAILGSYPAASGFVFDLPHVEVQAEQAIANDNLAARCRFIAGDFFERVPAAADVYLLKSVLHDWDDTRCLAILKSVHAAMRPDSRLLIVERPLAMEPDVVMSDLTMLAMVPGGRERTESEYRALLEQAGLRLNTVVQTSASACILEARQAAA